MTRNITAKGVAQRQEAAKSHGVYAFERRGEAALSTDQRGKYAELQDQLSTRQGAIDALREQATQSMFSR